MHQLLLQNHLLLSWIFRKLKAVKRSCFTKNGLTQNRLTAIIGGLPEFTGRFKRWNAEMEGLSRQLTERLRELKEQEGRANDGGLHQEGTVDPVQLAY